MAALVDDVDHHGGIGAKLGAAVSESHRETSEPRLGALSELQRHVTLILLPVQHGRLYDPLCASLLHMLNGESRRTSNVPDLRPGLMQSRCRVHLLGSRWVRTAGPGTLGEPPEVFPSSTACPAVQRWG